MNNKHVGVVEDQKNIRSAVIAFETILEKCSKNGVSDIHIDPKSDHIIVRVRIDGMIEDFAQFDLKIHEELISKLKILSGSRTDLHDVPQDGRFNTKIGKDNYSVRVSFMPTFFGENAVLRLLPMRAKEIVSFAKLGFGVDGVSSIMKAISNSHGMILVTGPTGSGKTTTLHTCLTEKAKENISIIALEDPIEYEIQNIRQVHVKQNHGVTFANVLRSVLRQDPDVIMVGEIRDSETANVAMHTALTGHLVLSTIHTNSALETITRLIDMKIDPYIITSTLKLIISQRLVRNICRDCMSRGCSVCRMSGYFGRSVLMEIIEVDEKIREMIVCDNGVESIKKYILKKGWKSIEDDALEKIDWGITTREEVERVLGKQ